MVFDFWMWEDLFRGLGVIVGEDGGEEVKKVVY